MRKLKTWEMFKELTDNPSKKFKGTDYHGYEINIYWESDYQHNGYLYDRVIVAQYHVDNEIKPFFTNGLYVLDRTWTEVIGPVSYEVAYKDCKETGQRYRGEKNKDDEMWRNCIGNVYIEIDSSKTCRVLMDQLWIPID